MTELRKVLVGDGNPRTVPDLRDALPALNVDIVPITDATFVQSLAIRHRPAAVIPRITSAGRSVDAQAELTIRAQRPLIRAA